MDITERMVINLCKYYLDERKDISKFLETYNTNNNSPWMDFLILFNNYPAFPSIDIIQKGIVGNRMLDIIDQPVFFNQLLNNFVDYFYLMKINFETAKKLFMDLNFSYLKFIIICIIGEKNDKIENYKNIYSYLNSIDNYYEKDINDLFKDFINCCISCVENGNINEDYKIAYVFKILDFFSKIRDNMDYELYKSIKDIFFEVKSDEINLNLENNLNNYLNAENIKKDIILILSNKMLDNNKCSYSILIEKCFNLNIEKNYIQFQILFFDLLNKDKLISYINNNDSNEIKTYDLKNILNFNNIKDEIIQNNEIENNNEIITNNNINNIKDEIIQNNEIENNNEIMSNNINNIIYETDENYIDNNDLDKKIDTNAKKEDISLLKENLTYIPIRKYFMDQIKKYSGFIDKNSVFYKFINSKNFDFDFKKNIKNINKHYFPIIHAIYSNLLENINDLDKNYDKKFGFIVINKKDYIYTYDNEKVINNFLYNPNNIIKYNYDYLINNQNLNEIKSMSSMSSVSNESNSNEKEYKYDLTLLKGFELENNSIYLFKTLFNLKDLPNYFFHLQKFEKKLNKKDKINKKLKNIQIENENNKKTDKNEKLISFSEYSDNLFSNFLETDGAYINDENIILKPKFKNYNPFIIHKTFVYSNNSLISIDEDLEIGPKTIIIIESKVSIPKDKPDFSFEKIYSRSVLDKTLIFTLNKLIKKIKYYKEFIENEFLTDKKEIGNYKFLLCLIYNNIPILDIDKIVENDLNNLINSNFIENEFKLKILYLIPNLGSYNLMNLQEDINNLREENKIKFQQIESDHKIEIERIEKTHKIEIERIEKTHKNEVERIEKTHKIEIEKIRNEMEQIKLNHRIEMNKMNLNQDILYFQYMNLMNQFNKNK